MSKEEPRNKQDAYCYQLEDDVRVLRSLAHAGNETAYNCHVETIIQRLRQSKFSIASQALKPKP